MGSLAAVGVHYFATTNQADELSSEGVADKAVDDEVDTRVDDCGEMSNMSEATNQHDRLEEGSSFSAVKDIVNMKELIDINNDSGTVKDEKGHNNTEKDEEKVDLFFHLLF